MEPPRLAAPVIVSGAPWQDFKIESTLGEMRMQPLDPLSAAGIGGAFHQGV